MLKGLHDEDAGMRNSEGVLGNGKVVVDICQRKLVIHAIAGLVGTHRSERQKGAQAALDGHKIPHLEHGPMESINNVAEE